MYVTALESQNKVVRFLVSTLHLCLAALFKGGKGGGQQNDRLILAENAAVSVSASPTKKNVMETLYTKLRNDPIHAEERGGDPEGAIAAIETHIKQFQGDVALVFSHCD